MRLGRLKLRSSQLGLVWLKLESRNNLGGAEVETTDSRSSLETRKQLNKKKWLNLHLGPSESRTNRRLGSGLGHRIVEDSGRKGSAREEREKEGKKKKKESVGLRANGLGFSLTLACSSPEGRNEAWALPEFGLNPESQNRPDSAIHSPIHFRFWIFRVTPLNQNRRTLFKL
ncbi:hypothetical protein CDL15_Pgr006324 [Punica granatum]|uniref:Uncharacterized protein n=1 Tax=Punica granatum TaxID=22663 RepID=A0A218WAY4_PUNGR|nr:hypothetical protein CDL15_Pgr006324 [Punica granatum]